jgi:membrane-associated phospholipid phosphatase
MNELTMTAGAGWPPLYEKGLALIAALQSYKSPALTRFMLIVSGLVSQYVFFFAIILLYWLINEKKAFRIGILLDLSAWLVGVLKHLFKLPRPFHLEPDIGLGLEAGYGFPSGHSRLSLVFIAACASWLCGFLKNKAARCAVRAAGIVLAVLVALSRLYLGVHFPQDVLGGWGFGGLCLLIFFIIISHGDTETRREEEVLTKDTKHTKGFYERIPQVARSFFSSLKGKLIFICAVTLIMNVLSPFDLMPGALFLGFAGGYAIKNHLFNIPPASAFASVSPMRNIFKLIVGFSGAALLYLGLKALFPGEGAASYSAFRFVRYVIIGFWGSAGLPWVAAHISREKAEN